MSATALRPDLTAEQSRRARLAKIDLDEAIYEAAEQHPDIWPRGLITKIATELGVTPATVRRERTMLLPGVKSAPELGW
ncbi:hypothetical protein MITS9509_02738 [Synechococcus sp. MIT S9509]|uniref:hypothetical protein n=1 Tax=unclassified Synechococcus TaxID=2626047 RepID=UPI0007BBA4A8|nr:MULTISPECIES: hypothetical protein [unclassified Synechococcus]KZR85555.1 hypothetical protein MITS9504_02092 [Synechococcus sp. MIT S9504]KZR90449.1 hypothetical protein MITS9509_02738 [Synechococcus sp. MIT S9509]